MPFYRMDFDGKPAIVHINLGRRAAPAPCVARDEDLGERCSRMSVALCDHPAGTDVTGKPLTCDAPICEKHRTRVGVNRDHCPRHETQQSLPLQEDAYVPNGEVR